MSFSKYHQEDFYYLRGEAKCNVGRSLYNLKKKFLTIKQIYNKIKHKLQIICFTQEIVKARGFYGELPCTGKCLETLENLARIAEC